MSTSLVSTGIQFPDSSIQTTAGSGMGMSQTWQNMTASRVSGTTYTNSTGKPIAVILHVTNSDSPVVDGTALGADAGSGGSTNTITFFTVPSGSTYSVTFSNLTKWMELR